MEAETQTGDQSDNQQGGEEEEVATTLEGGSESQDGSTETEEHVDDTPINLGGKDYTREELEQKLARGDNVEDVVKMRRDLTQGFQELSRRQNEFQESLKEMVGQKKGGQTSSDEGVQLNYEEMFPDDPLMQEQAASMSKVFNAQLQQALGPMTKMFTELMSEREASRHENLDGEFAQHVASAGKELGINEAFLKAPGEGADSLLIQLVRGKASVAPEGTSLQDLVEDAAKELSAAGGGKRGAPKPRLSGGGGKGPAAPKGKRPAVGSEEFDQDLQRILTGSG